MKLHVMMTLAALMFMAPATYAKDATTPQASQPAKEMAKAEQSASPKKSKKKIIKPLTPKEREEMERRIEVTEPMTPEESGVR